jgi:hypothetical protein
LVIVSPAVTMNILVFAISPKAFAYLIELIRGYCSKEFLSLSSGLAAATVLG